MAARPEHCSSVDAGEWYEVVEKRLDSLRWKYTEKVVVLEKNIEQLEETVRATVAAHGCPRKRE